MMIYPENEHETDAQNISMSQPAKTLCMYTCAVLAS